ncbi:hypothetical protein D3C83_60230 [compost metagenome]
MTTRSFSGGGMVFSFSNDTGSVACASRLSVMQETPSANSQLLRRNSSSSRDSTMSW